jgi:hypothetical protein
MLRRHENTLPMLNQTSCHSVTSPLTFLLHKILLLAPAYSTAPPHFLFLQKMILCGLLLQEPDNSTA